MACILKLAALKMPPFDCIHTQKEQVLIFVCCHYFYEGFLIYSIGPSPLTISPKKIDDDCNSIQMITGMHIVRNFENCDTVILKLL